MEITPGGYEGEVLVGRRAFECICGWQLWLTCSFRLLGGNLEKIMEGRRRWCDPSTAATQGGAGAAACTSTTFMEVKI